MARPTPRNDLLTSKYGISGYIGRNILPVMKVYQKASTKNIVIESFGTAVTTRDPSGVITPAVNKTTPKTYAVVEMLSRQIVDASEEAQYGGRSNYELVLSIIGRKECDDIIETRVKTALEAADADATDISADLYAGLRTAIAALGGRGRLQLSGPTAAFDLIRNDATIKARMLATGVAPAGMDPRSISGAQIAAILGIQDVQEAVGPAASIWTGNEVFLTVIPEADMDPAAMAQLGRLLTYVWSGDGGEAVMSCEADYDTTRRSDCLDFVGYNQAWIINDTFIKRLALSGS